MGSALGGHLPSMNDLLAAGADGFEVANRHREDEDLSEIREIDAFCRANGLLRVATSDDHGRLAGSPCITFLPGRFPADPAERRRLVLVRLRERGAVQPLVFARARKLTAHRGLFEGLLLGWRYFAALEPFGRLSWLAWTVLAWIACRRLSGSLAGSRAPARASSPR